MGECRILSEQLLGKISFCAAVGSPSLRLWQPSDLHVCAATSGKFHSGGDLDGTGQRFLHVSTG